jgi:hypothetical protein
MFLLTILAALAYADTVQPTTSLTYHDPKTGQEVVWKLVSRKQDSASGGFREVWQDSRTSKLWGSRLDSKFDQAGAIAKCSEEEGYKLPSLKELRDALEDGMVALRPELEDWYWTSTLQPDSKWLGWESDSRSSGEYISRAYKRSVICVSR